MNFTLALILINPDGFTLNVILGMVVTIILLIASALVSGSEVAFFSLSPQLTKSLVKEQSPTSESILEMIQSPRELLATILISNNFINVAIILLSSLISAEVFLPTNLQFGSMVIASSTIVFLINVVLITFLILLSLRQYNTK